MKMVMRRKLRDGGTRTSSRRRRLTLQPITEEYLRARKLGGAKNPTVLQEQWALRKVLAVTDTLPVDRSTALSGFDGNYAPTARKQLVVIVKAFFTWVNTIYGMPNPLEGFRTVRGEPTLPRILTEKEIGAMLQVATDPTTRALIELILDTGIRIGEVVSLTKASVRRYASDRYEVEVNGKKGDRHVPVSADVAETLLAMGDDGRIWISRFGGPLRAEALRRRLKRVMRKAGVKGKRLGPHTLRHTFATAFIRNGGDVAHLKELLGHTSIEMTQKYITLAARDLHVAHGRYGLTAVMGLARARPMVQPAHVTTADGIVNRVDDPWLCPSPEAAELQS